MILQCIFVVPVARAEGNYEELIPDYFSFNAPTRIAACGDSFAVFDDGEVVLFRGAARTVFPTAAESCDKLCLSNEGVYLLSGVGQETEDPILLAYDLSGAAKQYAIPSAGVTDISVAGDRLYTLSSAITVNAYDLSSGVLAETFSLPNNMARYSLYLAAETDRIYFRSAFGNVFSREGTEYSASVSVGTEVVRFTAADGSLYYEKEGSVFRFGETAPILKKGAGDTAFLAADDVAAAQGRMYVLDKGNLAVKVFDLGTGDFIKMIGSYGRDLKRLRSPIAISAKQGKIVVADAQRASLFTEDGVRALNGRSVTAPTDVVLAADRVYLADGGILHEYNGGLVHATDYNVGSGECKYVAAAPNGTVFASSGKDVYAKRAGENSFKNKLLTTDGAVTGLNVGIGGKILYVQSGKVIRAYSQDGVLLGALETAAPAESFAVDYRGNVYCLVGRKVQKYVRIITGYADPVSYDLPSGYGSFADFTLDEQGKAYVIADHNVLIYPKTAFGAFVAEDSDFRDEEPNVSPRFVCEVVKDSAISYVAPDNFEDITSIPRGTLLMCYATVRYNGDEYLRVETEKGIAYLPKSDVKVYGEGTAPFAKARCLIPAIGSQVVGVNLYEEPSKIAIREGVEPLYRALGKEQVFDVVSYVAADEEGKDVWGFFRVEYEGRTAYVLTDEVVSVDAEPEPMPTKHLARIHSDGLGKTVAVYKEADRMSEEVARLTDGTEIYMLEPLDKSKEFISVLYEGETCYVLSENLGLGGLSGGQILAIVLSVAAVIGSVLTVLILRANKRHKRNYKE